MTDNPGGPEDGMALEVTYTFTVPVLSTLPMEPTEMASHMREEWMNDDSALLGLLSESVDSDFDMKVQPVFYDL